VLWFVAKSKTQHEIVDIPSKSIRIRAGMMSISVPTNPTIAPTCNDAVSIHPHQKPIPSTRTPTPNPPSTNLLSSKHMKPIRHDNRRSSPANTDHAGAYAFRHQELLRARERGFAWGLNSWEGRREVGGLVAEGERKKERVGRGRVRLAIRSTWMRKKTFSAMTEYAFRRVWRILDPSQKGFQGQVQYGIYLPIPPPLSALSKQQSI